MFEKLQAAGFEIDTVSHAEAVLAGDFPEVAVELETVLSRTKTPIREIIGSGGGEAKATQRLRRSLNELGWIKHRFVVERTIDGRPLDSRSHEVDHVKRFERGVVALEIEWNNKDPFYDRDLENFKRLHADGAISVGIIVTRGSTLQDDLMAIVSRFASQESIVSFDEVGRLGLNPTRRQRASILKRVERKEDPVPFRQAWVESFVRDKFGTATTHWNKLQDRIQRGVGNPCPLVLIGLPTSVVAFDK